MKLHAPGKNRILLDPVRPSIAEEAWYRAKLRDLLGHMHRATAQACLALYPKGHIRLVPEALHSALLAQEEKWAQTFDDEALGVATGFVWRAIRHHDLVFGNALKKVGFEVEKPETIHVALDAKNESWKQFQVKFSVSPDMEAKIHQRIAQNVDLIKKIPRSYHARIREITEKAVMAGRELKDYTAELTETGAESLRHAALIARDQNNKITGFIHQQRQQELGIERAVWIETYASIAPREDTHGAFADGLWDGDDGSGPEYDVATGVDFDDGMGPVVPGEAINCGCFSQSIIPGYDEDDLEATP